MAGVDRPWRPSLVVLEPPAQSLFELDEAKTWLLVSDYYEDVVIEDMVRIATDRVETDARVRLLTQTVQQATDCLPSGTEPLPLFAGPVQSVSSVETYGRDDAPAIMSALDYVVDAPGQRVLLAGGAVWPESRSYRACVVTFVAGWLTAAMVPSSLRDAARMQLRALFERRALDRDEQEAYDRLVGAWTSDLVGDVA